MSDQPVRTPLYSALHAERYARQEIIRQYEQSCSATLLVMVDYIYPWSPTLLEELLYAVDKTDDLHLVLNSPGGDGESAIGFLRAIRARCQRFTSLCLIRPRAPLPSLPWGLMRSSWGPQAIWGR